MRYISKRLMLMIPTFFLSLALVYTLIHLTPGGPLDSIIMKMRKSKTSVNDQRGMISSKQLEKVKEQYGLNLPLERRFFHWLGKVGKLDFGDSFVYGRPAVELIKERLPVSLQFGVGSFVVGYAGTIFLGFFMVYYRRTSVDFFIKYSLVILTAIPSLLLAIFLILFLGSDFGVDILPIAYLTSDNYHELSLVQKIWDRAIHFILPFTCHIIGGFSVGSLILRNKMMEELGKDYVTMAKAKGVKSVKVLSKHVLKNAIFPLITGIGGVVGVFLSGSLIIETVFQLPGIGLLGYEATINRDYNLLMALIVFSALAMLVGNLVSDLALCLFDPRVDFKRSP